MQVRLRDDRPVLVRRIRPADKGLSEGLGTALGLAPAEAAQARGVRAFTATILPGNRRAQRLFARIAEAMTAPPTALAA